MWKTLPLNVTLNYIVYKQEFYIHQFIDLVELIVKMLTTTFDVQKKGIMNEMPYLDNCCGLSMDLDLELDPCVDLDKYSSGTFCLASAF